MMRNRSRELRLTSGTSRVPARSALSVARASAVVAAPTYARNHVMRSPLSAAVVMPRSKAASTRGAVVYTLRVREVPAQRGLGASEQTRDRQRVGLARRLGEREVDVGERRQPRVAHLVPKRVEQKRTEEWVRNRADVGEHRGAARVVEHETAVRVIAVIRENVARRGRAHELAHDRAAALEGDRQRAQRAVTGDEKLGAHRPDGVAAERGDLREREARNASVAVRTPRGAHDRQAATLHPRVGPLIQLPAGGALERAHEITPRHAAP